MESSLESQQNQNNLKKSLIWVFVIVGVLSLFIAMSGGNEDTTNLGTSQDIDTSNLAPPEVKSFYMSNNLMCEINKSTEKDEKGKSISLLNLETKNPQALFSSGLTYDMDKISETDSILVIQFVSPTSGSTDTITLYKDTGEFIREAKGTFLGNYSYSSSGKCK